MHSPLSHDKFAILATVTTEQKTPNRENRPFLLQQKGWGSDANFAIWFSHQSA